MRPINARVVATVNITGNFTIPVGQELQEIVSIIGEGIYVYLFHACSVWYMLA